MTHPWDAADADPIADMRAAEQVPVHYAPQRALFSPEWIDAAHARYAEQDRQKRLQRRRARWILAAVLVAAFLFGLLWPCVLVHT